MFETIAYDVADGVATIRLNRPQHHNAINSLMSRELPAVWACFKRDPSAVVAIITAAGERAFCSGADISDLPDFSWKDGATEPRLNWTSQQNDVWKPVICAVNGMVVGGGLHFIADADIAIAAEHATFFDPHVRVGLVAALEPIVLSRKIPMEAVLRMALMAGDERLTARRALEIGLISETVAAADLPRRALEIASSVKKNSPRAMADTKRAIWQSLELPLQEALRSGYRLIAENNKGPDFREGQRAFMERREPRWSPYVDG